MYTLKNKTVWVAGHTGMVGSAVVRRLTQEDCKVATCKRSEVDLLRQVEVENYVSTLKPDVVVVAAAKVGGILANDNYPADFLYQNLVIESNIIHSAHNAGVEKLLFLGSSCIYPKLAEQPIAEDSLLTGALEPTNQWYAIAKIAGIKLAQAYRKQYGDDFISAMPTNLYGSGDNYDLQSSHVLPALIRKAHEAKINNSAQIEVWGSGEPRREFLHADDCADALIFLLKNYSNYGHINVGSGVDISIKELTTLVCEIVGFSGEVVYDTTKPDGTMRKLMDASTLRGMGWSPAIPLRHGIASAYTSYLNES